MSRYIGQYVSTYNLYLYTKTTQHPLIGELHSFPVSKTRWDMLSVDFMVELPKSFGYDTIITVVDSISQRAYFIPIHMIVTVEGTARLFLHNI